MGRGHVRQAATRRCRRASPFTRGNQLVWFSDFLDDGVIETMTAPVARRAWKAIWCASSIRRKRIFPIPAAPALNRRAAARTKSFGRAERIRDAYRARFTAHGEADRRRGHAAGLDLHHPPHRSRAASALIALHAAIGGALSMLALLSPISFGAPLILAALLALPVLWWLLRVTPPLPRRTLFPPLRLLRGLEDEEQTPAATPWWLLLLRLLAAALLILALADPLLGRSPKLAGAGPLVLVVDNGWTAAKDWDQRQDLIADLLHSAQGRPVAIIPTAGNVPTGLAERRRGRAHRQGTEAACPGPATAPRLPRRWAV